MQDYILYADTYVKTSRYLKNILSAIEVFVLVFNYTVFIEAAIVIRGI